MNRKEVRNIVIGAINEFLKGIRNDTETVVDDNTGLVGEGGILDSLGFIQVVVDIEEHFKKENAKVSLTSEEVMARQNSPFRSVETLVEFITQELGK